MIRFAENPAERSLAIEYIAKKFMRAYGTNPPPSQTPSDLIVAVKKQKLVGTIALCFGSDGILPYEHLFYFDEAAIPLPEYRREKSVYYTRWNSSVPGIGKLLWLAANKYAQKRGALFSSLTAKDFVIQGVSKNIAPSWHPIQDAILRPNEVAPSDYNYFFTDPIPLPWLGTIREQILNLAEIADNICRERNTVIMLRE